MNATESALVAGERGSMHSGLLSVSDVARLRGCDHSTAWRLLVALERTCGARLVRQKRAIHIHHDELRQSLARMPRANEAHLQRELRDVKKRLSVVESEVKRFRQLAHEWFKKTP